jgi:penicillin-binding protein 2A
LVRKYVIRISLVLIGFIVLSAVGFLLLVQLTPFDSAKLKQDSQPTVVYANDSSNYMTIGNNLASLPYEDIPKNLRNAVVATEDHTFWTSSSINFRGLLRAAVADVGSQSLSQGASTIPEQLAKIVYLTDKKTLSRKLMQTVLGVQIDRHFTKQEILTMYLNRAFLGENSVGVEQAAVRYFGVDLRTNPNALTLDQAAMLAGLPQAPSAYDPLLHPQAAITRRKQVLQNMAKYGDITEAQAKDAEQKPLGAAHHSFQQNGWASHPLFTNFLFDYAQKHGIRPEELTHGGLKIYTTVNPRVQQAIDNVFFTDQYAQDFPHSTSGKVVEGTAVFMDPKTGAILGAAGSRKQDYTELGTDRVYSQSSPGSAIKPIMEYAPAIESGKFNETSILDNSPQDFGGGYTPRNWNTASAPGKVTLQYGIEWSQNIASVWLLQHLGIGTGAAFAERDGIPLTDNDKNHLGIAIGGLEKGVNALQMAQAYEPFASQGVQMQAHLISKIVNAGGQVIYQDDTRAKQIMSADTATKMTRLMEDVVQYGTGQNAQVPNWGVAGKTGTVQYSGGLHSDNPDWIRNAWFDGYTPNLVGSIYLGYDSPVEHMNMTPVDPSANCAKIFGDIVKQAEAGQTPQQFSVGPFAYANGQPDAAYNLINPLSNAVATYDASQSAVHVSWKSKFQSPVMFVIQRDNGQSGNGQNGGNVIGQTQGQSITDSPVQPGNTYTYTILAIDANNPSQVRSTATAKVTIPTDQSAGQPAQANSTDNYTSNGTGNQTSKGTDGNTSNGTGNGTSRRSDNHTSNTDGSSSSVGGFLNSIFGSGGGN